jgi:hypothetical protein
MGEWKLVEWFEDGAVELYNLKTDPGEARDLAEEEPEVALELLTRLQEWRLQMDAKMPRREETGE